MRTHTVIDSPVGDLTLVAEDGALVGLYMVAHRRPATAAVGERASDGFQAATEQLGEYFAGERREFDLRLAPLGNAFQLRVWDALGTIPYGRTWTYGDLAEAVGDRRLAQAVGSANARNPLGIVVPCHRVIGADGSLTGYAGGLERKRLLLALEDPARAAQSLLF